ncbi:4Fe-4S binding protein [Oscillospiraceae bacterium LTW-04]|nr:4Fe-4S binding protein [Oscillospiraceae bacterium MB24-C1]
MNKAKKKATIDQNACVACGCCVGACPIGAVRIFKGSFAVIDESKCVGCGKCAKACPASVIKIEVRE